jgi:5'-3' exonuclease
LEITPEERRQMRTLISPAEKQRRRKEKHREAGVMSREEYEGRAARRRSEARRMHAESVPLTEIAAALGVSCHTVRGYVSR